jgi:hypothetical protein
VPEEVSLEEPELTAKDEEQIDSPLFDFMVEMNRPIQTMDND